MKHLVLYLMLLIAVPATAQRGLFGSHSHHHPNGMEKDHRHGSLTHHEHHAQYPTAQAMNSEDFEVAFSFIAKETFDSKRLEIAKNIVKNNWVSSKQIASICRLFTYDSNRVEFAKFAYPSCIDKGMYFLLDATFTYSSSREELHDYLSQY